MFSEAIEIFDFALLREVIITHPQSVGKKKQAGKTLPANNYYKLLFDFCNNA